MFCVLFSVFVGFSQCVLCLSVLSSQCALCSVFCVLCSVFVGISESVCSVFCVLSTVYCVLPHTKKQINKQTNRRIK